MVARSDIEIRQAVEEIVRECGAPPNGARFSIEKVYAVPDATALAIVWEHDSPECEAWVRLVEGLM
jgi:hypothetical protein